jgi:nitrogen fixation NifU-like protein
MSNLYREELLDHYHDPRNFGVLEDANIDVKLDNPTCGDTIHLTAKLDEDQKISKVMFEGHGCVVSMASASLLTEEVIGKSSEEIQDMELGDIEEMLGGLRLSMGRVKCALLSLNALKKGLKNAKEIT